MVAIGSAMQLWLTAPPDIAWAVFGLMLASYSVGRHTEGYTAAAGLATIAAGVFGIAVLYNPDDVVFPLFIFGIAPWVVGRTLRTQTDLARELAEKEARVAHLRELEQASAVAGERSRVARELHDVLAHNLSVMVIQASAARRALATDPQAAIDAAGLIERTGREALIELRHVFGPVRHGEGEALEGSPGLDQIETLVERARQAGLPVTLAVGGDPVRLGPGAETAGYRLIQEALTNALKHAGAASTRVSVRYRPDGVALEVVDDGGRARPAAVSGAGQGLVGMRERIGVYGGEVEAGPREGGGFAVRARLPVERAGAPA
jgi:signal transduction histidine kinase